MEKNVPGKSNVTTEHLAASQKVSHIMSNKDICVLHNLLCVQWQLNRPIVKNLFLSFRTEIFPQIFTYAAYVSQSNNEKALFSHHHSFVSNVLLHEINLRT